MGILDYVQMQCERFGVYDESLEKAVIVFTMLSVTDRETDGHNLCTKGPYLDNDQKLTRLPLYILY